MRKFTQSTILVILLLFSWGYCEAQLTLDITKSPEELIKNVLLDGGDGVKVGNIKYTGSLKALAYFEVPTDHKFGIEKGIMLSTGLALSAAGPNSMPNRSDLLVTDGDKDLRALSDNDTYDAAILEFDFVPLNNKVSFQYVFASEEFIEFTGSKYNDVFAFFISGPSIEGKKNMAILPKTKENVSINTVNQNKNTKYFVNNNIWQLNGKQKSEDILSLMEEELISTIEYDGMTVVLNAETNVIPFKKYHFKIAIADVSDRKYNSAVFLKGGSFKVVDDPKASDKFIVKADINPDLIDVDAILKSKSILDDDIASAAEKSPEPVDERAVPNLTANDNVKELNSGMDIAEAPAQPMIAPPPPANPSGVNQFDVKTLTENLPAKFENVMFNYGSSQLTNMAKIKLNSIIEMLNYVPSATVKLSGHTDARGSSAFNLKLSKNRVNEVYNYFALNGIDVNRIEILSYGEAKPISNNNTESGRAMNRRVEILFLKN